MSAALWLVIASICDCNRVAITVIENPSDLEPEDDGAVYANGPDWRALVPYAARALSTESGRPISGMCTVVYPRDSAQREAITTEAVNLVYATADAVAGGMR